MAFATINYYSRSLEWASSFNVIFPDEPSISPPWSVFYLLHGLYDDHTTWMRRTSIERYVAEMPLVPFAPAVAAAIYDATGAWVDDLPMTPERILTAITAARARVTAGAENAVLARP